MKKRILGIFVVAIIAAAAAFNVNFNTNERNELSAISLANVEALAQEEEVEIPCELSADDTCTYTCKDANGNTFDCNTFGMKRV